MGTLAAPATTKPTVLRVAAFSGSIRKDSWHAGLIRAGKLTHPDHSSSPWTTATDAPFMVEPSLVW
jgi:hypothetical protein